MYVCKRFFARISSTYFFNVFHFELILISQKNYKKVYNLYSAAKKETKSSNKHTATYTQNHPHTHAYLCIYIYVLPKYSLKRPVFKLVC